MAARMSITAVAPSYEAAVSQWAVELLGVKTGVTQAQAPLPEY